MKDKRFSLLTDDMTRCYLTGTQPVEIHEVFFGTADRKKSIKWGCCVPLAVHLHNTNYSTSVHRNKEMNLMLKQKMQKAFEEKHSHELFMEVFHKNYI